MVNESITQKKCRYSEYGSGAISPNCISPGCISPIF